jgi:hypothetical protein
MRPSLVSFETFGECLKFYSVHVPSGEICFRDSTEKHDPSSLLRRLSSKELKARIIGIESASNQPTRITIRILGFFSSSDRTYEMIWMPERQGWHHPDGGGKSIHYYVPQNAIANPPSVGPGLLVSLCKISWTGYDQPLWPEGPKCKNCQKVLDALSAGH